MLQVGLAAAALLSALAFRGAGCTVTARYGCFSDSGGGTTPAAASHTRSRCRQPWGCAANCAAGLRRRAEGWSTAGSATAGTGCSTVLPRSRIPVRPRAGGRTRRAAESGSNFNATCGASPGPSPRPPTPTGLRRHRPATPGRATFMLPLGRRVSRRLTRALFGSYAGTLTSAGAATADLLPMQRRSSTSAAARSASPSLRPVGYQNHLTVFSKDQAVDAAKARHSGGRSVFGMYFDTGMGHRNDATAGCPPVQP